MKNKIFTTIAATIIAAVLLYFVNKDMNNGATLTDALSGVSGWITTTVMLLLGKDDYIKESFTKKSKQDEKVSN